MLLDVMEVSENDVSKVDNLMTLLPLLKIRNRKRIYKLQAWELEITKELKFQGNLSDNY
jgi:hypothetical protein